MVYVRSNLPLSGPAPAETQKHYWSRRSRSNYGHAPRLTYPMAQLAFRFFLTVPARRHNEQRRSDRCPGILLRQKHDGTSNLLDKDLVAFETVFFRQPHGLTLTVFEQLRCFHVYILSLYGPRRQAIRNYFRAASKNAAFIAQGASQSSG